MIKFILASLIAGAIITVIFVSVMFFACCKAAGNDDERMGRK